MKEHNEKTKLKTDIFVAPVYIVEAPVLFLELSDEIKSNELLIPKIGPLIAYTCSMGIGLLHLGWAIMGSTMTAPVLIAKFDWTKDETKLNLSLIGNMGLLGVLIGSLIGGFIIEKGRRKATIFMNIFIYIGASISLILTVPTICIGRFICGLAAAVFSMTLMKTIYETVPE